MELSNGGGHLESLVKDALLPLNADVLGPLHESGEVSLWLDVTSQSEVAWVLLEERSLFLTRGLVVTDDDLLDSFLDLQESLLGGQHERNAEDRSHSHVLARSTYHND